MAKVYSCACCGSDVTVPYFFKGAAYGYTCIKRVNPSAKKVKDNGLWVKFDSVEMTQPDAERPRYIPVVTVNGVKFALYATCISNLAAVSGLAVESKLFRIAEHANGAKPFFKTPVIVTEVQSNGSRKVTDVLIKGESVL